MGKININIAKGSLEKPKVVLGIDLGTTNSLAAYVPKGESSAEVISIRGNETVPSVIHFNENDFPEIGFLAKENAHKTLLSLLALGVYCIILWGHFQKGWRGRKVTWFAVAGATLLTLAYFGSRFVREFIIL